MKKLAVIILSVAVAVASAACSLGGGDVSSVESADTVVSEDVSGDYKIAMITSSDALDSQENLTAWEGVVTYGDSTSTSYKYFVSDDDTTQGYVNAVDKAIANGGEIVVLPSAEFIDTVVEVQSIYPDVCFLLVNTNGSDSLVYEAELSANVHCVEFKEEQAGYLAGYFSIMEGYTSVAFIGDGDNESNKLYAYGFIQGADDATQELRVHDVYVKYTFIDADQKKAKSVADDFYEAGVEVIFACNDTICSGVAISAEENGTKIICGERNHSEFADLQLTSVVYDANEAIELSLSSYFTNNGEWVESAAGKAIKVGIENGCISLATDEDSWHFESFSTSYPNKLIEKFVNGEVEIDTDTTKSPPIATVMYQYVEK